MAKKTSRSAGKKSGKRSGKKAGAKRGKKTAKASKKTKGATVRKHAGGGRKASAKKVTRKAVRKAGRTRSQSGKQVYYFGKTKTEGDGSMKELIGGKGANLAEMTSIGLPVPPGFTITTETCAKRTTRPAAVFPTD